MSTSPTELIVPQRFCGPPSSGNGGWTAGALAALVPTGRAAGDGWPAIRVALRMPPPLDTPLPVGQKDGQTVATSDGSPVASATVVDQLLRPVTAVTGAEAAAAMATFPGLTSHPFPTCFACGVDREEGDGLRVFPGQVTDLDGSTRVAATWTPHPSVAGDGRPRGGDTHDWHGRVEHVEHVEHASLPVTWAALDCIGGWAGDLTERLMVLAGMTARVDALPQIGVEHVLVGADRGHDGRKTFTASSLYTPAGRLIATAEHLWIAVDPAAFR